MKCNDANSRPPALPTLVLSKQELLDTESALQREWLLTNGIGGYASSTVLTVDTRRYHGLMVAAVDTPAKRTLLLAHIHESLSVAQGEENYSLHTVEYHDGTLHPVGHIFLQQFRLEGLLPVWCYRCRDVEIEKTIWFEQGHNTLFIQYKLLAADRPVRLRLEPFTACRDYHGNTQGDPQWRFNVLAQGERCLVEAFPGASSFWLQVAEGSFAETGMWYWRILHRRERERGYADHLEDLYTPGVFGVDLQVGKPVTLMATMHSEDLMLDPQLSLAREIARQSSLLLRAGVTEIDSNHARLVLAADQFVGTRGKTGHTVFAGYHWFDERSRDAMIATPGLCLATGRQEEARSVLSTFASYLHQGLLPHAISKDGDLGYDSMDSTLWLFEAVARYERATGDSTLVDELLGRMVDAIGWYERGTLHGIGVDPTDGLLRGGEPGLHLTWMDAQFWDWVVTPRQGKPVEAQALWYNALRLLSEWRAERQQDDRDLLAAAERCRTSFNRRFWNDERSCCFDLVDGPGGPDPALRPNQLFTIALTHPVLDEERWEPVLGAIDRELLTPYGLRSLAPSESNYEAAYIGDQHSRDGAYHQGTVWPWLLGAYVDVGRRVRGDSWDYSPLLGQLASLCERNCLGQPNEIFDGNTPHQPRGCIARAWNVAELLRLWPGSLGEGAPSSSTGAQG